MKGKKEEYLDTIEGLSEKGVHPMMVLRCDKLADENPEHPIRVLVKALDPGLIELETDTSTYFVAP